MPLRVRQAQKRARAYIAKLPALHLDKEADTASYTIYPGVNEGAPTGSLFLWLGSRVNLMRGHPAYHLPFVLYRRHHVRSPHDLILRKAFDELEACEA